MSYGGGVAQWVARLTRDRWILVSREFEPRQRHPHSLIQELKHWLSIQLCNKNWQIKYLNLSKELSKNKLMHAIFLNVHTLPYKLLIEGRYMCVQQQIN